MPRHKKKKRAAAAPAASSKKTDWLVGDLVVAKLRGHRPWPAQIQKPEDYGYDARPHSIFVTFFGTEETCFCSFNKITPFTSAVRKGLAEQLQKINTNPELERAIKEIFAADDELKSVKGHGANQKEDDEMASEKSEDEEAAPQPQAQPEAPQRSRKRGRAVEEAVAPAPPAVESERPSRHEKTVTSMAAEQVQKLPRKVRIKVSTQGTDLASVSSSQARQSDPIPPLRVSESSDAATTPVKNGDTTPTQAGSSVPLPPEAKNSEAEMEEEPIRHAENGVDAGAAEKAEDGHASTADHDPVDKMEVDDEKSLVSKPSEPSEKDAVEKSSASEPRDPTTGADGGEKALTSTATTSEPPVIEDKEKEPVTLETAEEDLIEKMEVDDEKVSAAKVSEAPLAAIVTVEDSSVAAKESIASDPSDGGVEKMEVDEGVKSKPSPTVHAIGKEDESTIGKADESAIGKKDASAIGKEDKAAIVKEDESVKGDDPAAPEKAQPSNDSLKEPEAKDSSAAAGLVQDAVTKDGVTDPLKSQDNQRESGAELDRAEKGSETKISSVSTQHGATGEAPKSKDDSAAPLAVSAIPKEEAMAGPQDRVVPQEAEASKLATKDEALSISQEDGAIPAGQPPEATGHVKETAASSEPEASRLNQGGAVDHMEEDQAPAANKTGDGAVEKVDDQDGAAKDVAKQGTSLIQAEENDGAVMKLDEQDGGDKVSERQDVLMTAAEDQGAEVKLTEHQGAEVEPAEHQGAEVKPTEHQSAEVKQTLHLGAEVKTTEHPDTEAKKAEGLDAEVKKTEHPAAEVKEIEGSDAELKKTEGPDAEAKTADGADAEAKIPDGAVAEVQKDGEDKKTEAKGAAGKETEEKGAAGKETEEKGVAGKETEEKGAAGKEIEDKGAAGKETEDKGEAGKEPVDTDGEYGGLSKIELLSWDMLDLI